MTDNNCRSDDISALRTPGQNNSFRFDTPRLKSAFLKITLLSLAAMAGAMNTSLFASVPARA
jgi:hypothetical protein